MVRDIVVRVIEKEQRGRMPNYVPGCGPYNPDLMLVAEAPGAKEDEQLEPLVGPTGEMVNNFLYQAGLSRSQVYLTNVVKYRPPFNDMDKLSLIGIDIDKCVEELWQEIERNKPKCIIAMGNYALRALLGLPMKWDKKKNSHPILNYRGSILLAKDRKTKVVPTIHPAALFNRYNSEGDQEGGLDYVYHVLIQHDIKRAVEESRSYDLNLPRRDLTIARNSLDLVRYFRLYEKLKRAAADIESINCIPVCISFAFTRFHAISVPLLRNIGKIKLTEMGDLEMDSIWDIVNEKLTTLDLIGQNFKYDEFKLNLMRFGKMRLKSDTLIKTRVIFPELPSKKLNVQSSYWTREPYYKEEGKEFKIGKSPVDQLFYYNAKDSAVTLEIDEEQEKDLLRLSEQYKVPLQDYYYNYQMRKHSFYLQMESVGFKVDLARKKELYKKYTEMHDEVHQRLVEEIGHGINVRSPPQMYSLLYKEMGFKAYKNDPTSEDSIVKLIGNHCKGNKAAFRKILEDCLEERRIRNQKSKNISFSPDYDGRCKTSFNIIATETCRSSTSVLKKPLRPRKMGLAFHTISKHGRLAKDIRSMFIPDEGKIFLQADSSQAEARVVAVLSKDWQLLKAFDTVDIHRRTAALILGLTSTLDLTTPALECDSLIGKDSPERFCGKKTRHAGNYHMGKSRFMVEFNTDAQKFEIDMEISEWRAGNMLEKFHFASPLLKDNFWFEIEEAINSTGALVDPFGGVREFHGRKDSETYKEGYANLPQRTVSHLVQGAALKVEDELNGDCEHLWISENHDSLLLEVPANNWEPYAKLLKREMERPIDFNTYCTLKRDYALTIPCDIELSSTNYGEMKKVKV